MEYCTLFFCKKKNIRGIVPNENQCLWSRGNFQLSVEGLINFFSWSGDL